MPDVFKLQLLCLDPAPAHVRTEQSNVTGERHHALQPPFKAAAVRGLLEVLEKGDLQRCELDDAERDALRDAGVIEACLLGADERNKLIGQRFFDALFPGSKLTDQNVRGALDQALDQAQSGEAVPFQLRFDPEAVDLARLPWELIYHEGLQQHPVRSGRLRLTRYITYGQRTPSFPVSDRLELLVVAPRPLDRAPLSLADQVAIETALRERQAIETRFGNLQTGNPNPIRVHLLAPPTLDALTKELNARPYHVVHFDGHGGLFGPCPKCGLPQAAHGRRCVAPQCNSLLDEKLLQACLAFERSDKPLESDLVSADHLATILTNRRVRLFVASSCQSATVAGLSVFGGLAPRLIQAGVPAVVAMQFSMPEDSAADFAGAFYSALAGGQCVAGAAAAGRSVLVHRGTWYIPTVYLRSQDEEGCLFDLADSMGVRGKVLGPPIWLWPTGPEVLDWAGHRSPQAAPYKGLSPYEANDTRVFYGRSDATQRLKEEVLQRRLVVLHGPPGVGKTSLVNAGLIPALLGHNYLVLTVREYGDPVATLRQAVAGCRALGVDLSGVQDLPGLVDALLHDIGRPLIAIFDQFEEFLRTCDATQPKPFMAQFAACVKAGYELPVCLLLVLRDDFLGHLRAFGPEMQENLGCRLPLELLNVEQAEQAIMEPLAQHQPKMKVDPIFLQETLLPGLAAQEEGGGINPTHLQIVCQTLYQAAVKDGAKDISRTPYAKGGIAAILKSYLEQTLKEHFKNHLAQQDLARILLKQMVSAAGKRAFLSAAAAAEAVHRQGNEVEAALRVLLEAGLLETSTGADGGITFSLSHEVLVPLVLSWFDRAEAFAHAAQDVLDHAWENWMGKRKAAHQAGPQSAADMHGLLVEPDCLREIKEQGQRVRIAAPQFCLLLHSAVHHRTDMGHWAHGLHKDAQAQQLLRRIQDEPAGMPLDKQNLAAASPDDLDLALGALGLHPERMGNQALARAAVSHPDGVVRHTAVLALAALGLEEVSKSVTTLAKAAPPGRRWRQAQALAQMKAAGFALSQLPLPLLAQVNAWTAGIRLFEARWQLAAQAIGAGLGGGLGLMLPNSLVLLAVGYRSPGEIAASLLVGGVVGAWFAGGRWLLDVLSAIRVKRVLGGALGFCLGLLALWPFIPALTGRQLLGGLLAGAAVAGGWEFLANPQKKSALVRATLGGMLGGAVVFAATALLPSWRSPFVLGPEFLSAAGVAEARLAVWVVALAALAGGATGAGMAAGGAAGEKLWRRLSEREESRLPSGLPDKV